MIKAVDTRFTITKPEYIRALRRHYRTRLQPIRDGIASFIAVCGGLILLLFTTSRVLPWLLIIPGIILGLLVAYACLLLPTLIFQAQPKLRSEYQLSFSDDAIRFKTDEVNSTIQWSTYNSWTRDNEFFILYHGTREFTVVPLRALQPGDSQRLEDLLNKKMGLPQA